MPITLHGQNGERVVIGRVSTKPKGEQYAFRLTLDHGMFEDQFLSMRPFKCLRTPQQLVCHLPYPYEKTRVFSAEDMADLEYELLFLHKRPTEWGIDAWNGLYYQMELQGDHIEGTLKEVDLNILASPPEPVNQRPLSEVELHPAAPGKHAFPRLTIP